ncbi:hypothetical protein FGG08_000611 [Glutinoglossum americanum]|uniref:Ankyrin n=1 Tax=Glutinoglossum americanum TaxID=1670608 RepID=A0A9P8I9Y1_9PEZI|nr:hypothetical protein FGG08_000611 [Glutinoglossum americanum]
MTQLPNLVSVKQHIIAAPLTENPQFNLQKIQDMGAATASGVMALTEDDVDDLIYFARAGELADLKEAIEGAAKSVNGSQFEVFISAVDPTSRNGMLHMAAANGHTETVKYLLSLLPSPRPPMDDRVVSSRNSSGNTPLHWASLNGHLPVVKLLFEAGADPTILNDAGHDAVYEAEINSKDDVVGYLLTEADAIEKASGATGVGESDVHEGRGNGTEVSENKPSDVEISNGDETPTEDVGT